MNSSAAYRWFAPEHENEALIQDYAVVGWHSEDVRKEQADTDSGRNGPRLKTEATFDDVSFWLESHSCYEFAHQGQLVYADVDEENPMHKEDVYGKMAKESPVYDEAESVEATEKQIFKYYVTKGSWEQYSEDDYKNSTTYWDFFYRMKSGGPLEASITEYIFRAENKAAKEELLQIMSGQTTCQTKRPVLVLIGMIDDLQSIEIGVTKGWAMGYDFLKELLIIKPFISKPDHHPLGENWYIQYPSSDGISFCGSFQTFAQNYIAAAETHTKDPESTDLTAASTGFKILIHTFTARWLLQHWSDLPHSPSISCPLSESPLREAISTLDPILDDISFPEPDQGKNWTSGSVFPAFQQLQRFLQNEEYAIQSEAQAAKMYGDEEMAMKAAKVWDGVMELVRGFNEWKMKNREEGYSR